MIKTETVVGVFDTDKGLTSVATPSGVGQTYLMSYNPTTQKITDPAQRAAVAEAAGGGGAAGAVTVTALSADRAIASGDLGANLVLIANRAVTLAAGLGDGYNTQFSNGSASSVTITVTPGSGVTLNGGTAAVTRTLAAGQTTALLPTGTNAYILPGA